MSVASISGHYGGDHDESEVPPSEPTYPLPLLGCSEGDGNSRALRTVRTGGHRL